MLQYKDHLFESTHYLSELLSIQQDVLEKIALGANLKDTLNLICSGIELIFAEKGAKSSVLLLEGAHLKDGAAPSLPEAYVQLIDGIEIGPNVGSCGTAAYLKKRYIASNTLTDPNWQAYQSLVNNFNLKACWSTPIISSDSEVLGTFAVYYDIPQAPSDSELKVIDRFTHLTGLAIEKERASRRERELNSRLKYNLDKMQAITKVLPDLALIFDDHANYIDSYGTNHQWHLAPTATLKGKLKIEHHSSEETLTVLEVITRTLRSSKVHVFEYKIHTEDGYRYFESRVTPLNEYLSCNRSTSYVLWMARDITERIHAETEIQKLAYSDSLTGLPNRRYLLEKLLNLMGEETRLEKIGALLYLDLDNFKGINDSLGHSTGDVLLAEIGERLSIKLHPKDTIARIGGDEFVVLLSKTPNKKLNIEEYATQIATELLGRLKKPFRIEHREMYIKASIGITIIDSNDTHADNILTRADTAMYSAKRNSEHDYCFFDPKLHETLRRRLELTTELSTAIENREIETFFQPKIAPDGAIVGAEALVRWFHPVKGPISPVEFISIAEESGLIAPLQKIVMEDSCWLLNRISPSEQFKLSINVSAEQFKLPAFVSEIRQLFNEQQVPPERITLELTESMLVTDIEQAVKQMEDLKSLGFNLSIDDFGTGYSSLAYLQTFPIDELKIDKSFVDNMFQKSRDWNRRHHSRISKAYEL
ncbi:EAL domain-containing protein [Vibrio hannami]|uniref:bifunctional diguanylate cyclase/phosphodiesterase n=1 Tax=Vibrio hannami TaxID=2717094 RepID=UPI0024104F58|nr:EAL domain-containing protein [Vibrio hannami]MDG3084831.1 EAL domain-containing protein [Vibrio hannami]